jgi:deoxyribodipyrimidine photo-lyase
MRTIHAAPTVHDVTSIWWIRRDLRVQDNPALNEASADGDVLPIFIFDPVLWNSAGPVRRAYLVQSLRHLNESLGGNLLIRSGNPVDVLPELAHHIDASSVHIAADFGPYGRSRDEQVEHALAQQGRGLIRTGSPYAIAPGRVTKADGTPYRVYTPFYRAWLEHGWRAPAPKANPSWVSTSALTNEPLPDVSDSVYLPPVGETAAYDQWLTFKESALAHYDEGRNRPDISGTSMLSAHLRWGEIHPRTLLAQLDDSPAHSVFRKEIAWREFYADVLHHAPATARTWLNPKFEYMEYESGPDADELFEAWTQGRTGYPFVDAGMRQLLTEGWMHNRVRMVTASFLVKDLHLPWQRGAAWFMKMLRDGDIASNQHGWQWVAGSGTDASPYFRIFNPVTQGLRFDPDGDYIRKYIPELHALPGKAAHEPWEHPLLSVEYPERIVDHAQERDESLRRYAAIGEDKSPLPTTD